MRKMLHIAGIDLKIMVRDKVFFFWTLIFPMFFIFIFGNIYKDQAGQSVSDLMIINQDQGKWGEILVEKVKTKDISIKIINEQPEEFNRILIIPQDFSKKISEKKTQNLVFLKKEGASYEAAVRVEMKIIQAFAKIITQLIITPDAVDSGLADKKFQQIIHIKSGVPPGANKIVPYGYDHVIPGTLVQFILMMVLIYGGIMVMMDRQSGTLARMLFSSLSKTELWGGKFIGRLCMGLIQAFLLIAVGKIIFKLNLGNNGLAFLIILLFSAAVASLSILIGSLIKKEDLIIGLSVLLANMFAALGGCWWPLEVVPAGIKTAGMISPAYWAMDGFHKIIFFNKGFMNILPNLAVFIILLVVFSILSIKFFKIKDAD